VRSTKDGRIHVETWREVVVAFLHRETTVENMRELEAICVEHVTRSRQQIGLLAIIDARSPLPDEETRRQINKTLERMDRHLRGLTYVIHGSGFQAAAVRAVIAGFTALKRRSYPLHVTGELQSALSWMLPRLEGGASRSGELEEVRVVIERAWKSLPEAG